MNCRKRKSTSSEVPDTAVIKWDGEGTYSTVKACKIASGTSTIGESVTVKVAPGNREFTGKLMFLGTAAEAENEITKLTASDSECK